MPCGGALRSGKDSGCRRRAGCCRRANRQLPRQKTGSRLYRRSYPRRRRRGRERGGRSGTCQNCRIVRLSGNDRLERQYPERYGGNDAPLSSSYRGAAETPRVWRTAAGCASGGPVSGSAVQGCDAGDAAAGGRRCAASPLSGGVSRRRPLSDGFA